MGWGVSNSSYVTKEDLDKYVNHIVDKNGDGVISRSELESYVKDQLESRDNETEKWKLAYADLKDQYDILLENSTVIKPVKSIGISTESLKKYIEDEIISSDGNLKLVPDALERKIYLTVYKTVMTSLKGL